MGMEGLEPSRHHLATDFKSAMSTNFITFPIIFSTIILIIENLKYNILAKNLLDGTQIRTGDRGFAIHCLTTWPYRQNKFFTYSVYYILINFVNKINVKNDV